MVWEKKQNTAQYAEASWDNFVRTEPNCTPEEARRIAFMNPKIIFYFFCRDSVTLTGQGKFDVADAVFFSGEPSLGSAPECDTYIKKGVAVAYIGPPENDLEKFKETASYTNTDGSPAIDVVCIFAGNYCTKQIPMLRANNNKPSTDQPLDTNVQDVLNTAIGDVSAVKYLQNKRIVVLLTIMGGWSQVGWSQFNPKCSNSAQAFVEYLEKDVVKKYGLDGIDIDDEYSEGPSFDESLAMVSTLMKKQMPDKLLTQALLDETPFTVSWKGHTLAKNLDYGWEMSYFDDYYPNDNFENRLSPYVRYGMNPETLALGFSAESRFSDSWATIGTTMKSVMDAGYGGGMLFRYEHHPNAMVKIVKAIMEST